MVKDRWHYYLGYEYVNQDLRDATKVIQQSAVTPPGARPVVDRDPATA